MQVTRDFSKWTQMTDAMRINKTEDKNLLTKQPLTPEQEAAVERQCIARENTVSLNAEDMFIRVSGSVVEGLNSEKDIIFKSFTENNKSVTFNKEDVRRIGEMVLTGLQPNRFYINSFNECLDYEDYARMAITKSAIRQYSEDFLTEDQAEVVNSVVSNYIKKAIEYTDKWIADNRSETLYTNGYYKYYGNFVCTDKLINQTQGGLERARDSYVHTRDKALKYAIQVQIEGYERDLENASFWMSNSASEKSLISAITDAFECVDLTNPDERKDAMDKYYSLMKPVVSVVESGSGFNNIMNIKMKAATDLIDSLVNIGYSDRINTNV